MAFLKKKMPYTKANMALGVNTPVNKLFVNY